MKWEREDTDLLQISSSVKPCDTVAVAVVVVVADERRYTVLM